ncbi:MAG: glycosyltransferase [Candidatus Bathyarchaeia archaeon]
MKVLVLHPSLNRCGGAERVCLATVKALSASGYSVHLATIEETDWKLLEKRVGPVQRPVHETYLIGSIPISSNISNATYTVTLFLILLARYRVLRDFDLNFNTYGDLDVSLADISYINAIPFSLMRLFPTPGFQSPSMRGFTSLYSLLTSLTHKTFTRGILLANSKFTKQLIEKFWMRGSTVVYPPVDLDRFREVDFEDRENVVVTVTRFRPGKELEIIPQIAKKVDGCRFVVFGLVDAGAQETLKQLKESIIANQVSDRVEIRLNQCPARIAETLLSSKVYLHTQSYEAFGISIVEAMAAGCVPVIPRRGGPWMDILGGRERRYGLSFNSVGEAISKIETLLSSEETRIKIAQRAVDRAAFFDRRIFERRIAKVVDVFLSKRRPEPQIYG